MDDNQIINFVRPYTSVSIERIQNVLTLVETCVKNNIEGDFVEIGVWKGGLIMAMALKCIQMGVFRAIHAYDTFTGMTQPTEEDVDLSGNRAKDILSMVACICTLDEFKNNISKVQYSNIIIHQGDILKVEPKDIPDKIAILRLDTDWYESTKFELVYFEPRVETYGYVIVDDYGHWSGSRKAVDEFKPPYINRIDYTGIWWCKDYGKSILENVCDSKGDFVPVLLNNFHHFININKVLEGQFWHGCGSYLFDGQSYKYQKETLKKQEALFKAGKQCSRVLEIGVYLGHSLLILLLSNPDLRIDCIDIDSRFSPKVVEYLNSVFNNRISFYLGSAKDMIPRMVNKYDLIHIDADHNHDAVIEQFTLSKTLADPRAWVIFDDYEAVKSCIDEWVNNNVLELIEIPWCLWTNIVTKLK